MNRDILVYEKYEGKPEPNQKRIILKMPWRGKTGIKDRA